MTDEAEVIKKENRKSKVKSVVREWVESIVIAFILAMFIRTFFIQAFKIPSGSMRMTLVEGDRLIVNKLKYGPLIPWTEKRLPGLGKLERGDIIVFIYPEDPKRDFIKRLIAFGGETVEIRGSDIYVDDKKIDNEVIDGIDYVTKFNSLYGRQGQKVKIPEGMVYVLGDNSRSSHDSRYWGFVPESSVIGKAEFIYWPVKRLRMLK